ncbi:MAG: cell division protein FtsZ [Candidatus Woesearchaeota archaeon]
MQNMINNAKKRSEEKNKAKSKVNNESNSEIEKYLNKKMINVTVIGTGGAGNNTLNRLIEMNFDKSQIDFYAMNTDAQDLLTTNADRKILLGKEITRGLGAGSDPKVGEEAAKSSYSKLKKVFEGKDLVFLTCGLGGGTGTGSSHIIAKAAKEAGALVVAISTLPYNVEGRMRMKNAIYGLKNLEKKVDSLILIPNDKLLEIAPDIPLSQAFKLADEIIANALKGTIELILKPGLVNLDFADMKTVMKNSGLAMIGVGESDSNDRSNEAVDEAINNPLLDIDINGGKGALINITGDDNLNLDEATNIVKKVSNRLSEDANVIWGAQVDSNLKNKINVMVIVTGINKMYINQFKSMEQELDKNEKELEVKFID